MKTHLFAWLGALFAMAALDGLWLGVIARGFVKEQLGPLLLDTPRWGAAGLFYLLYAAGVWFFAIRGGLEAGSWQRTALHGAALGFIVYMTYDLTNLATLKGWSVGFVLMDIVWGTVATAAAASAGHALAKTLG